MKKLTLLTSTLLFSLVSANLYADGGVLSTAKAVVNLNNDAIRINISFNQPQTGDLYVFTEAGGNRIYLQADGTFDFVPTVHTANTTFSGTFEVYSLNTDPSLAISSYPVYSVVTTVGGDPLHVEDWVSGIATLNKIGFRVGQDAKVSGDFDGDGFSDTDRNRDGFFDDDRNQDGFHDDDANQDGFRDNDNDRDGFSDDDLNQDGFSDDDLDQDGFHDGDRDFNGIDDNDEGQDGDDNDGNDDEGNDDRD